METPTWVLAIFTVVLAFATIGYAYVTYKLYKGAKEQVEALKELTKAILQLPIIEEQIQRQKKLAEDREKAGAKNQRNAVRNF
jgi:hypothetical protein